MGAYIVCRVSPLLKRQKKERQEEMKEGREKKRVYLYIILMYKIIQIPIHYALIRRKLHQETITKRRHRPHKEMNVKLSKTKNYLTLVSMYEINSLLKEFKCSFPTMVDFAVIFSQK